MSRLMFWGASDDLIESEGLIPSEEWEHYGDTARVEVVVDGVFYAELAIDFSPPGSDEVWRIADSPNPIVTIVKARGEDFGNDEDGCPGYSDKAIIDMGDVTADRVLVRVSA